MGLVEQLVTALLVKGYANDTQLQSLFYYMMRTGDAARFNCVYPPVAILHSIRRRS